MSFQACVSMFISLFTLFRDLLIFQIYIDFLITRCTDDVTLGVNQNAILNSNDRILITQREND